MSDHFTQTTDRSESKDREWYGTAKDSSNEKTSLRTLLGSITTFMDHFQACITEEAAAQDDWTL